MKSVPLAAHERIVTIDIIRGFALFGIFLVNMPSFHSPVFMQRPVETGLDFWIDLFFQLFIQTKFYTIFSFLFGLGFYIFMSRAEQKSLQMNRLFARRLGVLFLIGAVHYVFLWYGDILHTYAVAGLFLLLFYKRKLKTILIWAAVLLILFHALLSIPFFIPEESFVQMKESVEQNKAQELGQYVNMYEQADYSDWLAYRFHKEVLPLLPEQPIAMMSVLAMFLFGLCAGRMGMFQGNTHHLPLIRKIWVAALVLSIPLVAFLAVLKLSFLDFDFYQLYAIQLFTSLSGVALCFFYISSLTLLLRKTSWKKGLRPLGYVGQMALTNYLFQTIICVFIFLILDFYGKISLAAGTLLCLIIYAVQVIFSYLWLRHFKFGPFEWVWRSLTYGSFQPMRKINVPEEEKSSKTI